MITIDTVRAEDRDALFSLFGDWDPDYAFEREAFNESFARCLDSPGNVILAAREGTRLVGYLQMFPCDELGFPRYIEVAELLVAKNLRGSGIGMRLMARAEEIAAEKGIREIRLSSQVHRSRAHVFYENMGYEYYKVSKFYQKNI